MRSASMGVMLLLAVLALSATNTAARLLLDDTPCSSSSRVLLVRCAVQLAHANSMFCKPTISEPQMLLLSTALAHFPWWCLTVDIHNEKGH
jgi:hypothetical protein